MHANKWSCTESLKQKRKPREIPPGASEQQVQLSTNFKSSSQLWAGCPSCWFFLCCCASYMSFCEWHGFKVRRWKQSCASSNCQFKHSLAEHSLIPCHLYPGKIILSCVFYMRLNWTSVFLLSVFVLFVDVGSDHIYQIGPLQVWDGASLPVHHLWAWVASRLLHHYSLFNFNLQFLHTLDWSASFKRLTNFHSFL